MLSFRWSFKSSHEREKCTVMELNKYVSHLSVALTTVHCICNSGTQIKLLVTPVECFLTSHVRCIIPFWLFVLGSHFYPERDLQPPASPPHSPVDIDDVHVCYLVTVTYYLYLILISYCASVCV